MPRVIVEYIDGTKEEFEETSRAGGSWCTTLKYEGEFAIIENAYSQRTIIPACRIKKIHQDSYRKGW